MHLHLKPCASGVVLGVTIGSHWVIIVVVGGGGGGDMAMLVLVLVVVVIQVVMVAVVVVVVMWKSGGAHMILLVRIPKYKPTVTAKVDDSHNRPTSRVLCDTIQIRPSGANLQQMLDL